MPAPVLYPITGAALLSEAAKALSADELRDQTAIAEAALGLIGTTLSGDAAERAKLALALQVNHQLEHGVEGSVYSSWSQGSRSVTYASTIPLSGAAVSLVQTLLGGAVWADMRSMRRGNR